MRTKSTGLGKMELMQYLEGVKQDGDYLIMSFRSTDPVRWHIRVALSRKDARAIMKIALKSKAIPFFLSSLFNSKEGTPPKAY